jgi:hypothetical protein
MYPQDSSPCQYAQEYVEALAAVIQAERQYPGRLEQRGRLAKVARAARLLQHELADATILSGILGDDPTWSLSDENRTVADLREIAIRAVRAGKKVRKGRGSHKDYVRPDGLAAAMLCALIVVIARRSQGKDAPATSLEVQDECEQLWRLARGTPHNDGPKQDPQRGVWREHLQRAGGKTKGPKPSF